jgi:gp16 family phage-associated protein
MKTQNLRTPQEIRDDWFRKGITQGQWAREHGVPESAVSQVLNGKNRCRKGTGHRIAVMLRLKDGEVLEGGNHD